MQRGRPVNTRIDSPSTQYIYNSICEELTHKEQKREQYRTKLRQCALSGEKNDVIKNLERLNIETELLNKIKQKIENPVYFDEVL